MFAKNRKLSRLAILKLRRTAFLRGSPFCRSSE